MIPPKKSIEFVVTAAETRLEDKTRGPAQAALSDNAEPRRDPISAPSRISGGISSGLPIPHYNAFAAPSERTPAAALGGEGTWSGSVEDVTSETWRRLRHQPTVCFAAQLPLNVRKDGAGPEKQRAAHAVKGYRTYRPRMRRGELAETIAGSGATGPRQRAGSLILQSRATSWCTSRSGTSITGGSVSGLLVSRILKVTSEASSRGTVPVAIKTAKHRAGNGGVLVNHARRNPNLPEPNVYATDPIDQVY